MDITFSLAPSTGEITARVVLGSRTLLEQQTPRGAANLVAEMAEEFRTKVAEFADWLRMDAQQSGRPAATLSPALPHATMSPSCKGCGTAVEKAGDLCPSCEHKNHLKAPEGMVKLKDQGVPAYRTEGNFRDLPQPEIADADIQRVADS
jgi:hypothetical protein